MARYRRWQLAAGILLAANAGNALRAQDAAPLPPVTPAQAPAASGEANEAPTAGAPTAAPSTPTTPAEAEVAPVAATSANPAAPAAAAPASMPAPASCSSGRPVQRLSFWTRSKQKFQECFIGHPGEFDAPPLGHFAYLHGRTQVANGEIARMTLYHYDFVDGKAELNARGRYQLEKIAGLLPTNFAPVVIEETANAPGLDEARRLAVFTALTQNRFPVPQERVVVGRPISDGLRGREAEIIHTNMLNHVRAYGVSSAGISQGVTQSGVQNPTVNPSPGGGSPGFPQ